MTIKNFTAVLPHYEAIQWTGDNLDELKNLLSESLNGGTTFFVGKQTNVLLMRGNGRELELDVGEWVMGGPIWGDSTPGQSISAAPQVVPDEYIQKRYAPVPDSATP